MRMKARPAWLAAPIALAAVWALAQTQPPTQPPLQTQDQAQNTGPKPEVRSASAADRFRPFEGDWNATLRTWTAGSDTPVERTAMVTRRVAHGGKALVWEPASARDRDALPLHTLIYNDAQARYEAVYSAADAPALVLSTGQGDGEGRTIILTGQAEGARWKEVHTVVDANATRIEFFRAPAGGPETRVMRFEFARRRPAPPPGVPTVPSPTPPRPIGPSDPTRPPPR